MLNWMVPDLLANMQMLTADLAEHPGTWCFLSKYPFRKLWERASLKGYFFLKHAFRKTLQQDGLVNDVSVCSWKEYT